MKNQFSTTEINNFPPQQQPALNLTTYPLDDYQKVAFLKGLRGRVQISF